MFISGALPSAVFFLALLRAPETPRFLFKSGRNREAQNLLAQLMSLQEAEREAAEITASLEASADVPGGYDMRRLRRALIVSFFLGMLIQISGINTIIDYAPLVFRSAGWKMDAALFSTFVIGAVNFILTLVAFWTIDRFGRKTALLHRLAGHGPRAACADWDAGCRTPQQWPPVVANRLLHRLLRRMHRARLLDSRS